MKTWTVVYVAQTNEVASVLKTILESANIPVTLKLTCEQQEEYESGCYEIMVPEVKKEDALSVLIEKGH